MDSDTTHVSAVRTPNSAASLPTTSRVAGHALSAGGTTTKEVHGERSHFQPPTDKTAPVGSASSQDRRRSNTRVQGGGGRSISHPRGMQKKLSVQLPHQEGNLPSRSVPSVPPPVAPEGTQPQQGGRPRSTLHNPMRLVAKFCSSGWKKDLEHMLWVYYKFNVASFKEVEWARLKEKFFQYFLQYKEEALGLKERCPM